MPRTLAIGDVHGCLTALDTLLGYVQPATDDQIIFLGDLVDRGPDTKGVLNRVIELHRSGRVVCLRGNHEVMMLGAREGKDDFRFWLNVGGLEAFESYRENDSPITLDSIPYEHWSFLRRTLVDYHETATHIFAHANVQPNLPMDKQSTDWLHWEKFVPAMFKPHMSGKTLVCGHTQQRSGLPLVVPGAVCIDTWAYGDGWLTCLDVATGEYWQATDVGEVRKGSC